MKKPLSLGVIGIRCGTCQHLIPLGRAHDCAIAPPPEPKEKAA